MSKVVVAMSGGVDSSVAAALLKEEGYEVTGMTMWLLPCRESAGVDSAIEAAREAAGKLGITQRTIDFRDIFARTVIDDFCREYSLGRTPNPCVRCNEYIKFGALWEKAKEMGADFLATGHYARIERDGTEIRLKKGADARKDQSYFLCRLTHEQLSRTLFPVGNLTKTEVKQIAREMGLPAASRTESREICFIPDDDHAGFLRGYLKQSPRPGPILDAEGKVLGEHRGISAYTIGQRHGLGIAAAEPYYVTAIAPEHNTVVVGTKAQTYGTELIAGNVKWLTVKRPTGTINIKAKIRYRQPEVDVTITLMDDDNVYVKFSTPQMAITPGQTIAFYDGHTVTGGGTIIRQGRQI